MRKPEVKDVAPRTGFHHGDLRNALLAAAERLVAAHGAEAFSLREAARDVGVTPNAAYRHFTNKADLLAALASQGFADLATRMEREMASAAGDSVAVLLANGLAYVRFAQDRPEMFELMFGPFGAGSQRKFSGSGPAGLTAFALLGRALDGLVEAGAISSERRLGAERFVWPLVHGVALLAKSGALIGGADTAFTENSAFLLRGLGVSRDL